jgi:hypothetical protein
MAVISLKLTEALDAQLTEQAPRRRRSKSELVRRALPHLLTCEAVVAETCFLLKRSGFDPSLALQFIERGVVQLPLVLQEQISNSWMARMSWARSRQRVANECRLLWIGKDQPGAMALSDRNSLR